MPDSYQTEGQVPEQGDAQSQPQPKPVRRKTGMLEDPVVRTLMYVAFGVVALYLVTVISAMAMGVLNPTEPRTRTERDVAYFEMVTAQNPKDSATWKRYINSLTTAGQFMKAQQVIDQATKVADQKESQDILSAQAELYLAQKKYDEAIKTADQVRKKVKAQYEKDFKVPGTGAAQGAGIHENYWNTFLLKANALSAKGDKKAAIKELDGYIKWYETAADALVTRGLLKADTGDTKGAEKDFRAALKFIPDDPAALAGLEKIGAKQ